MRYLASWHQPLHDYDPLDDPPNDLVLGWWKTGETTKHAILCAVISAKSPEAAKRVVLRDWPEATLWRFVEPKGSDFVPGDRFPLSDWMKRRFRV